MLTPADEAMLWMLFLHLRRTAPQPCRRPERRGPLVARLLASASLREAYSRLPRQPQRGTHSRRIGTLSARQYRPNPYHTCRAATGHRRGARSRGR